MTQLELFLSKLSNRLKTWRSHLGMTQEEFSKEVGINIGVLRKYENAVNNPGSEALVAIAKTGVSLNWLVLGVGPMSLSGEEKNATRQRLGEIAVMLAGMDDGVQSSIINEIAHKVEDAKRVCDLERVVAALKAQLEDANSSRLKGS